MILCYDLELFLVTRVRSTRPASRSNLYGCGSLA